MSVRRLAPWALFFLWFLLPAGLLFSSVLATGQLPVDFKSYQIAADRLETGGNPYQTRSEAGQIWLTYHQLEVDLLAGQIPEPNGPVIAGPYVYPPTLAVWLGRLNIGPAVFVVLLLLAVYGFGWLWLKSTSTSAWWLLLIIFSWDVLGSFLGGNVELLLLFFTLVAAWLIWHGHGLWAALFIAVVVLIKPFYALFFAAFGLLMLANSPAGHRGQIWRLLLVTAGLTVVLIGLEVWGWGATLRRQAGHYLSQALDYQWLVLPVDRQTPMSIWNRTALQGLVNAGLAAHTAQYVALGLWLMLLVITVRAVRNRRLDFPLIFALAFVLLYWGRPVGWGLIYLDIVVVATVWPAIRTKWPGRLLLGAAVALAVSHWLALMLTLSGRWLRLFTLQSAEFPWETWLVIPACWLLLVLVIPRLSRPAANT